VLLPTTFGFVLLLVLREKTIELYKQQSHVFIIAMIGSLTGGVLFMIPYFLWSQGVIPQEQTAKILALVLSGAAFIVLYSLSRRSLKNG
jgi:VIT1/CCC1 family predicted Fe2+/Mn2+ transporter